MRTIRTKLYKFSELNKEAKLKAVDWLRECNYKHGYSWQEESYESLKAFCELFNLKLKEAEFSEYASVDYRTGQIDDNILALSGVRLRTYIVNNYYSTLYTRKGYQVKITRVNGDKVSITKYSQVFWEETSCPFTGYCFDDILLYPIRQFLKVPAATVTQEDLLSHCIDSWVKAACEDCKDQNSYDYLAESIEANEYEFLKNGNRY